MKLLLVAGALDFLKPVGDAFNALRIPFEVLLGFLYRVLSTIPPARFIGAYGLSIIVLTLVVKTLLFPLFQTQLRLTKKSQAEQRKVAPELAELRKKYKKDPQKLNTEMMALYKQHGINPLSPMVGCLPTLAQFPILIGLYRAIYDPQFFTNLHASPYFLGLSLGVPASMGHPVTWILPLLAGLTTFVQSKMMTPPQPAEGDSQAAQMAQVSSTMSLLMPLFIVYLSFQSFALQGLVLYWIVSNLYSIFQQYTVNGWGQLPILGNRPGDGGSSGSGGSGDRKGAGGKVKAGSGSAKVLVGQTEPTSRRSRRR
ncbi:MAG TPA: YidC/Oxa1 family membrane protein insertase [Candidatus Dormibacteraeota bacterium]|nr:YidC/Oxa1 family membrane protein insertase [Candidatus Dormibacteraeota bacterium]